MQIDTSARRARIVAVLGPTNTGKTHLAMERMLGHATGMIGFPLRLLARENYDRAVKAKGRARVALITGEEKIVPAGARYYLCTVESMPLERDVAFLGIDEIQMCADPDRGHIFTDRLLNARGRDETMFMGADTIRPLLSRLVPDAEFLSRPRLSTLTYTGERKIARIRPRTAVVAFSAAEVYALAELVRRQRGGAAVVLGALSPRTRNAQVAMYQDGEVDYLVATDAIGMGLNMDVDHVAFAAARKFDGRRHRALTPPELAQTAGRAGRHMNDGTFGTTANIGPLADEVAERIESHRFEPLETLFWRNPALDFSSLDALTRSLGVAPDIPGLALCREADDEMALRHLAHEPDVKAMAETPAGLHTLWDVCQVPDFGRVMSDAHARLLAAIYRHLMGPDGRLPADWLAAQVTRLDRTDGDIETLAARISAIRTWTYVSYRAQWVTDAAHWQERTRAIEDRLSDALHRGLTQRFVDKRTAKLVSRIKEREDLIAAVDKAGAVSVEGHHMGHLAGFRFIAETADAGLGEGAARKSVAGAAEKALRSEIQARIKSLEAAGDKAFRLARGAGDGDGWPTRVLWRDAEVARLTPGAGILRPRAQVPPGGLLDAPGRARVERRLQAWLERQLGRVLEPLFRLEGADLSGAARGLVFQVIEGLGSVRRDAVAGQIAALTKVERKALRRMGVRIGRLTVFVPTLTKAGAVAMRGLLWGLGHGFAGPPPGPGRMSLPVSGDDGGEAALYAAMGYVVLGPAALRADMAERLAAKLWALAGKGPFGLSAEMMSISGLGADDTAAVIRALGYRPAEGAADGAPLFRPPGRKRPAKAGKASMADTPRPRQKPAKAKEPQRAPKRKARAAPDPDSPFAALAKLKVAR